jgi:hypothetical protein
MATIHLVRHQFMVMSCTSLSYNILLLDRVFFVSGHVKSKKVIRRYLVGYSFGFYHTEAVIFLRNSQIRKYAEDGGEDFFSFFCSRLFFCVFVPADFVFVG